MKFPHQISKEYVDVVLISTLAVISVSCTICTLLTAISELV